MSTNNSTAINALNRRTFLGAAGMVALASLVACSANGEQQSANAPSHENAPSSAAGSEDRAATANATANATADPTADSPTAANAGKSLIVLWSWSGNTLQMAQRLSEISGAEIYRIEAANPYPSDYNETADRAKQEQDDGIYPEIASPLANWDDYDTIFLGYPIWWYQLPMIVQGFVNDHDWAHKTIVPFNTHEGSGNGGTYDDLREMTGTTVLDGLVIRGESVATSLEQVDTWYASLGI